MNQEKVQFCSVESVESVSSYKGTKKKGLPSSLEEIEAILQLSERVAYIFRRHTPTGSGFHLTR